jgi:serine protease AprX
MEDPTEKLTPQLRSALRSTEGSARLPVIVRYRDTHRALRGAEPVRGAAARRHFRVLPYVQMQATPEAIQRLQEDPDVLRIEPDIVMRALLDAATPLVRVPQLWAEGLRGDGIRIAVVDTGLDEAHPDLAGRVEKTVDLTGEGGGDRNGHGTHCAGIAAGSGAASNGRYRGAAPGATLLGAKVLRANGEGMMSDVMAGVEWAMEQNVHIISLSLGGAGSCDGTDALSETCDAAMDRGIVVCVAAGNEGPSPYTIGSPGCARKVITVGASTDQDRMASFSSRGPTRDGRVKPDIVVPGYEIISARAAGTTLGDVVDPWYVSCSGTSMATPLAAGMCALLLQAEPGLNPSAVKERLMTTALDLGDTPYAQGSGRADAQRAWRNEVSPPVPVPTPPPAPGPTPGQGCLTALLQLLFVGRGRDGA